MIMMDVAATEKRGIVHHALADWLGIGRGDDRDHARRGTRQAGVHRGDPSLGNGRSDDESIGLVGDDIMAFGGIRRLAGGLERAVDPGRRLADDLGLIEQVGLGRGIEFHGISSSPGP